MTAPDNPLMRRWYAVLLVLAVLALPLLWFAVMAAIDTQLPDEAAPAFTRGVPVTTTTTTLPPTTTTTICVNLDSTTAQEKINELTDSGVIPSGVGVLVLAFDGQVVVMSKDLPAADVARIRAAIPCVRFGSPLAPFTEGPRTGEFVDPARLCEIIAADASNPRNPLIFRPLVEIAEEGKLRWEVGAAVAPREIRSEAEEAAEIYNDLYEQAKVADFDVARGRETARLLIVALEALARWGADNCGPSSSPSDTGR